MPNPLNPLDWVKSAQDWFIKSELSSGFRPYLIFLLLHFGFVLMLLHFFRQNPVLESFGVNSLYLSIGAFILLYVFKAIQDPNFCRSEKHVENVKRMDLTEQKGDPGPRPIDIHAERTMSDPQKPQLGKGSKTVSSRLKDKEKPQLQRPPEPNAEDSQQ